MTFPDDISLYHRRRVLYGFIGAIFLIFLGRLYQLQLIYTEEYGRKSEENSVRMIPREPVRGCIYDRNGVLVVDNRPAFTVTIMPSEFDPRRIPHLAQLLDLAPEFVRDRIRNGEAYSRFAPVKIRRDIDFRRLSVLEEHSDRFPGVDYQVDSKRYYPSRARATHLFGYTKEISEGQIRALGETYSQGDVVGSAGLEAQYEGILRGKKGAEFSTVNVHGQVIGRFEEGRFDLAPMDGNDLILETDIALQAVAESLMADRRGAVVAIDPTDGGILALVSHPDYDLSLFSGITPPQVWHALNADPTAPMFNRATMTRYPPGSTFKMVLALAALRDSVVTPSWRVSCSGAFRMGSRIFRDLHVHGSVNMVQAIQQSCNVYFYQLMLKTGLDSWSAMGRELGFGQLTGIDLYEENPGLLPTTAYMDRRHGKGGWTRGYLPNLGIGQGELGVSPLQMACYAMALANGGIMHQPHVVRAILNRKLNSVDTVFYSTRRAAGAPEAWNIVREGMRRVVQEPGGTGAMARIPGVQAAGKTGSAQNPHGDSHAWFVGFAPFDHPRIAVAVLVENAGYGGSAAAPVAGRVMEHYLRRGTTTAPPAVQQQPVIAGRSRRADPVLATIQANRP